jgi:dihydroorotate dehydrogenase (fumarate)
MVSDEVKCDLAASTGIHDGNAVIKCLLVGAKAVQAATTIYRNGPAYIEKILEQMKNWMKDHRCKSIKDFIGKLSQAKIRDPVMYERAQFMKYFSEAKI